MKRDRDTEGTEAGTGPEEMGETGESQSQRVESKTGDRHDHRDTQRAELARTDRDSETGSGPRPRGKPKVRDPEPNTDPSAPGGKEITDRERE